MPLHLFISIILLFTHSYTFSATPSPPTELALSFYQRVAICKTNPAVVTWTAPTQRADSSSLNSNEISAYKLYTHVAGQADVVTTLATNASPYTIQLKSGIAYGFSMKTVDSNGLESSSSTVINPAVIPRVNCRYRGTNS